MTSDQDTGPIINIRGGKVGLGPLEPDLVPTLTRWINDFPTTRTLGMDPAPMTRAQEVAWVERVTTSGRDAIFAIYELEDMAPVGSTNLMSIDHRHGTCELGIGIMEPSRRGKGLGTEAVRLITDYAIHGLGMHNVQLCLYGYNHAGYRAYTKAGFREYGRRREAREHNGRRWDVIYMDVIASEWESPVMRAMMEPDEDRG